MHEPHPSAEAVPVPDASLDAVVLGQAWHWVDPGIASVEIGRVVRSGGVLGLIWNIRDERAEWLRRLGVGDGSTIGLPYVTWVFRAVRSD